MGKVIFSLFFLSVIFILGLVFVKGKVGPLFKANPVSSSDAKGQGIKTMGIEEYRELVKSTLDNIPIAVSEAEEQPKPSPKERIKPKVIIIED
ncbi:MAG: hypothetical protein WC442_00165 [Candidatus Omnitrophota bacterium]